MNRHEFLERLHERSRPRTYLEIGVNDGRSLALSRVPTVAVDPAPMVTSEIHCDLHLVKATSDELFSRDQPLEHIGTIDLAFIDGMHLLEYALRDFINVERHSDWPSVIVLDDQLPRHAKEAARARRTRAWAGDVYKMIAVIQRHRPDLLVVAVDTEPTGVVVVFGADASSAVLRERYDAIVADFLVADPQQVPEEVITRACAIRPETLLDAPFWDRLVAARESPAGGYGRAELLADVEAATGGVGPRLAEWLPDPTAGRVPEADAAAAALAARNPEPDLFRRASRVVPILRRVPGGRAIVRVFRRAPPS